MNQFTENSHTHTHTHFHLCWRSIFTGTLVSLLVYFMLSALGAGIGGFHVAHLIEKNENGSGLLTGTGVWLGISSVVALFLGSFFATRTSSTQSKYVGGAQSVVVAALVFGYLLFGAGHVVGSLANMTAGMIDAQTLGTPTTVVVSPEAADEAARTVANVGWILFVTLLLGTAAAILGGYEGAIRNTKKLLHEDRAARI